MRLRVGIYGLKVGIYGLEAGIYGLEVGIYGGAEVECLAQERKVRLQVGLGACLSREYGTHQRVKALAFR